MSRYLPLALLATACAEKATHPFPEGFTWGTATAGFQVEMGCPTWSDDECLDRDSDWYAWVTDDGIVADPDLYVTGEDVRNGPGMWETLEDDVRTMRKDDLGGFRMSLEWSRLFPESTLGATSVDELLYHLHTLKGAAAGVGARAIADLARTAEEDLRAGKPVDPERIEDLHMAVTECSDWIERVLPKDEDWVETVR